MRTKFWNFRAKLLSMFAAIIIIPLVIVGILTNQNATKGIENQTRAGINALVQSLERETTSHINISEKILGTLAVMPVMATDDYAAQRRIFNKSSNKIRSLCTYI